METSFEDEKKIGQPATKIAIHGHGNIVNTGSMVDNVLSNAVKISEQGNHDIASALRILAEAIASAGDINKQQQEEYLKQIDILSEEALKPVEQRLSKAILRPVIEYGT
jgi:hypothetical protein